ncbi:hypothetical protein TNCV_4628401 [Trichonephila clavipes]|nr:hypothetical protein TNCV_4628401 [Trichonephila clavipes]
MKSDLTYLTDLFPTFKVFDYVQNRDFAKAYKCGKNKYWIARYSVSSSDRGSFRMTRSTNGRGFPGQLASELSPCLGDGKCREGMRSVKEEKLSPLVGQLVSH